jgi:predicted phage tail protein
MSDRNDELDRALDVALGRVLRPPSVPAQLRTNLQAALARTSRFNISQTRWKLEQEQREKLAEMEESYIKLRRRTLGAMIGGAFAAGAGAAVALPWLTAVVGPSAPVVVASTGTAIGIAIGFWSWLSAHGSSRST